MNNTKFYTNTPLKQKISTISKKLPEIIFGKKDTFNNEKTFFIAASLVGVFTSFFGMIWNLSMELNLFSILLLFVFFVGFLLLFYYSRFKNIYNSILYILITLSGLSLLYFMKDGLNGSIPAVYIIALLAFLSFSKLKYNLTILLVTMANLILLVVVEYLLASDLVIHYNNGESRFMDLAFGYVANLVVCYFILIYFKKKLINKNKELEKLNNSKSLLFNIIAHDLHAPLNNILGFTNIMNDKTENLSLDKFQKYSEIVNRESINAIELLDSLLEWGKIQMNKVQINPQPIKLYQITCEIIDVFKNKLDEKEIEVGIQIPREIYVFTDLDVIKTIMRNLVSNAMKFTPHGGTIVILAEVSSYNYVTIIVKDNGIGMNKEMIENLFLLQINTNRKGTDGEASNGLGLIITKELIEKQGGELMIESCNNQGCTFKFTVLKSNKNTN